jgi:hypothetical protein
MQRRACGVEGNEVATIRCPLERKECLKTDEMNESAGASHAQ